MCHMRTMPMRALKNYSPNSTASVKIGRARILAPEHHGRKHWLAYAAYVLLHQGNFHSKILTANLLPLGAVYSLCMGTWFESHSPWDFHNSFSLAFTAAQQKHPLLHINAFAWIFSYYIDTARRMHSKERQGRFLIHGVKVNDGGRVRWAEKNRALVNTQIWATGFHGPFCAQPNAKVWLATLS